MPEALATAIKQINVPTAFAAAGLVLMTLLAVWAVTNLFSQDASPKRAQEKETAVSPPDERQNQSSERNNEARKSIPAPEEPVRISLAPSGRAAKEDSTLQPARQAPPVLGEITFDTLHGGKKTVLLAEIWRLRPALPDSIEPSGVTVIDYAKTRLYVPGALKDLFEKVGAQLPLAELTAPNGQHVYLVASRITGIKKATGGDYHPNAQTIISTKDGIQQVLEPQEAVMKIIAEAKSPH